MTVSTGDFLDMNAQRLTRLERQHPNIHKLRPGVVRRGHPEPDRSNVEGFVAKGAQAQAAVDAAVAQYAQESEPEPVAAKKKKKARAKVDADTRAVAVARVDKLIGAGNPTGKAVASVAKELGVSESSIMNWRTAANHAKNHAAKRAASKPAKKKRASKSTNGAVAGFAPNTPMPTSVVGEHFIELILDAVGPTVRAIVREEIRRMLS